MCAQTITSICTIFVAVVALFVAIWQAHAIRVHNRLSVKPHLGFIRDVNDINKEGKLIIENKGFGPAIIKGFEVQVDGKEISQHDINTLSQKVHEFDQNFKVRFFSELGVDQAIGAGEHRELLIIRTDKIQAPDIIFKALCRINIVIKYESIYGEPFSIELNKNLEY